MSQPAVKVGLELHVGACTSGVARSIVAIHEARFVAASNTIQSQNPQPVSDQVATLSHWRPQQLRRRSWQAKRRRERSRPCCYHEKDRECGWARTGRSMRESEGAAAARLRTNHCILLNRRRTTSPRSRDVDTRAASLHRPLTAHILLGSGTSAQHKVGFLYEIVDIRYRHNGLTNTLCSPELAPL